LVVTHTRTHRSFFRHLPSVSQSVRREISSRMSVCRHNRPERDVWNLGIAKDELVEKDI